MASPLLIDLPHSLGRAEARRRLQARIGELPKHIPGGVATVAPSWPAEDRMAIHVAAMGQSVDATIDVEERVLRVALVLPPMLGMMSGMIADAVRRKGARLLLDDKSGD